MDTTSRRSLDRGAAAVELALVMPLIIAILFGIVEGGTRYAQQSQVNHWAFMAARDVAIDPSKNATTIVNGLKGSDSTAYTVTTEGGCTAAGQKSMTVTVKATKTSPTGMFGSYSLTGKGVARCEN